MSRQARTRSQSFFEDDDEEEDDTMANTPMPDFLIDADTTPPPPPTKEDSDVDPGLDDIDQVINDRRRSRSFFDQTDVASGLSSALPPQVSSDQQQPEKQKQPTRTGEQLLSFGDPFICRPPCYFCSCPIDFCMYP